MNTNTNSSHFLRLYHQKQNDFCESLTNNSTNVNKCLLDCGEMAKNIVFSISERF